MQSPRVPTTLSAFYTNGNDQEPPSKNTKSQNNDISSNADLLQTLQRKDEALSQAQRAVSSLESALEAAVSNLESMQQRLQREAKEVKEELKSTKTELDGTKAELENTKTELVRVREDLKNSNEARDELDMALGKSQRRVEELEAYLADMGVDASSVREKKTEVSCWRVFVFPLCRKVYAHLIFIVFCE